MHALRDLQTRCYRAFLQGDADALLTAVRPNRMPVENRIEVYRNNARETFRRALAAGFPVIEQLVGHDCFTGLSLKYMRKHPSRSGDLQGFGARFPDFLRRIYATTRFAYLADVARLERALEELHFEPDEDVLDPAELRTVPPEHHPMLVFRIRRAVRLLRSPYPVLSIWRANQPGAQTGVDLDEGQACVAVVRSGDALAMRPLDPDAFALASAFTRGMTLQQACEALPGNAEADPDGTSALTQALRPVIGLGLLSSFDVADCRAAPQ